MKDKIIVALDVNSIKEVEHLVDILSPYVNIFKVGMQLFYSCGPKVIDVIKKYDKDIFLDLKLYDIPNTVKNASCALTRLGVYMFNVHSSGGSDMMKAALDGAEEESGRLGVDRPRILGVTVLTSMDKHTLKEIGIDKSPEETVLSLARLTKRSGLDGVVSSPKEIAGIKSDLGRDFLVITPGVRPEDSSKDDQKRVTTPKEAFSSGADYIVIGRPITKAKDPVSVIRNIKL
ncbi:MAG: orotidine-5'-phosphate decarboxylase [Candidatus Omnitrophota bacterium]